MLSKETIARERAEFARDVEYLRSMNEDTQIQEIMHTLDEYNKGVQGIFESEKEDDPDLLDAIDQIPVDKSEEDSEIQRILDSDKSMNIDDVMGISDEDDEDIDAAIDLAEDELETQNY